MISRSAAWPGCKSQNNSGIADKTGPPPASASFWMLAKQQPAVEPIPCVVLIGFEPAASTPGHRRHHQKRLYAGCDRLRQRRIRWVMGEILRASEESQKRPPFQRGVIAHRSTQHRITDLQRVEDGALCDLALQMR